jgi:hypothetical protein
MQWVAWKKNLSDGPYKVVKKAQVSRYLGPLVIIYVIGKYSANRFEQKE